MADFFTRLCERTLGAASAVKPLLAPHFAAGHALVGEMASTSTAEPDEEQSGSRGSAVDHPVEPVPSDDSVHEAPVSQPRSTAHPERGLTPPATNETVRPGPFTATPPLGNQRSRDRQTVSRPDTTPEDVILPAKKDSAQKKAAKPRPGPPGAALEPNSPKSKSESDQRAVPKAAVAPVDTAAPKERAPIAGTPVEAERSVFATGAEKTARRHLDERVVEVELREPLERARSDTSVRHVVIPLDLDRYLGNLGPEASSEPYSPLVPPPVDAAQMQSEAATLGKLPEELAEQRRAESTEPPTVRVTIGRVEVRAVPLAAPRPAPTPPPRWTPALSLDDYLKQRNEGQR